MLVQEMKQRQTNGEQGLIIVNGKIVTRKKNKLDQAQSTSGCGVSTPMPVALVGKNCELRERHKVF